MQYRNIKRSLLVYSLFSLISASAQTVPSGMTYQGRLTDASNAPAPDGTGYEIEVRLWSAPTGGTLLWGTRYTGVPLKSGAFNLILGSGGTPIPGATHTDLKLAFNTPSVHLGLTTTKSATGAPIPSPTEILPRQQIFSTPYAFQAANSAKLAGKPAESFSPPGMVSTFAGATAPEGWVVCDGRSLNRITNPEYSNLFEVIGTSFGGTGETDFKVPDLRGRTAVGAGQGNTGENSGQGSVRALAEQGGAETHTLTESQQQRHQLAWNFRPEAPKASAYFIDTVVPLDGSETEWLATGTGGSGSHVMHKLSYQKGPAPLPHNNMSPFLVLTHIIKY